MKDGLPLAFHRVVDVLHLRHESGKIIKADKETKGGCKYQLAFYAQPGALLTIGTEGKPNYTIVSIDAGLLSFSAKGSRETHGCSVPVTQEPTAGCSVPLYNVYISVYDDWYSFGVAISVNGKPLINEKYGGALKPADRVFVNNEVLNYNRYCYAVQLYCNSTEFEKLTPSGVSPLLNMSLGSRVQCAINYGEVWEEWTFPPKRFDVLGSRWLVESSSPSIMHTSVDNTFHWEWPDGARNVHLWLGQAGGGGKGGELKLDTEGYLADGKRGIGKKFKVTKQNLTLHVHPGGRGGGKFNKPPAELGEHTTCDELPEGSSANGSYSDYVTQLAAYGWEKGLFQRGSQGMQCGKCPYVIGTNMQHTWKFSEGGKRGNSSLKLSEITAGSPGTQGVALFHYQY